MDRSKAKDVKVTVKNRKTGKTDKKETARVRANNENSRVIQNEMKDQSLRTVDRMAIAAHMDPKDVPGFKTPPKPGWGRTMRQTYEGELKRRGKDRK